MTSRLGTGKTAILFYSVMNEVTDGIKAKREERQVKITIRLPNGECILDSCSMLGTLGKKSRLNIKSNYVTLGISIRTVVT